MNLHNIKNNAFPIWISGDGRKTPINMMTDEHLHNAINYIAQTGMRPEWRNILKNEVTRRQTLGIRIYEPDRPMSTIRLDEIFTTRTVRRPEVNATPVITREEIERMVRDMEDITRRADERRALERMQRAAAEARIRAQERELGASR